jgi:4-hydroxybenzoate polyprenyltransferase
LLRSDLLLETGMAFIRNHPLSAFKPLAWLLKGKATLKEKLAIATEIDVTVLPYDAAVIDLIKTERESGRRVVLATASHHTLAQRVADHLQLFDDVFASDTTQNLTAENKQTLLVNTFGEKGFDYLGNSHDDLCVWASARHAYVVNPDPGVERRAAQQGNVKTVMKTEGSVPKEWIKAFRLHQWMKNALIFVPILAAHEFFNPLMLTQGVLAFLLFGICASSVYLLNDLLDLADDRHHKTKRNRPFAAGRLSIKAGLVVFPLLLVGAFGGALLLLPLNFTVALAVYYALTLSYSLSLKRKMGIDVIALALLYTMRIIAGTYAFGLQLTFWMLAFSMFMFLSLALVKRYAELHEARKKGKTEKTRGRGYYPGDLEMISSLGAASGYLSVMVLALYIHDTITVALYGYPEIIWLACPLLLFWITRIWLLTHRGQMHDDPVVFAIRDRTSLIVGILFGVVFWIAT